MWPEQLLLIIFYYFHHCCATLSSCDLRYRCLGARYRDERTRNRLHETIAKRALEKSYGSVERLRRKRRQDSFIQHYRRYGPRIRY